MFEKHKIQRKLMKCEETRLSKSGALELSKKRKNKLRCFKFLCKTPCSGWSSKEPEKKKHEGADGFRVSHGLQPWRISVESQNGKQSSSRFSDRIQSKLNITEAQRSQKCTKWWNLIKIDKVSTHRYGFQGICGFYTQLHRNSNWKSKHGKRYCRA